MLKKKFGGFIALKYKHNAKILFSHKKVIFVLLKVLDEELARFYVRNNEHSFTSLILSNVFLRYFFVSQSSFCLFLINA